MACPTHLLEFDSSVPDPEVRLAGDSINARLLERLLRHRHFLLMVENGLVRDLAKPLRDVKAQITDQLNTLAAQTGADAVNQVTQRRLERLRRAIDDALTTARQAQLTLAEERLRGLTERELEIQNRILRQMIPEGVHPFMNFAGPDVIRVTAILNEPLGGKVWSERMRRTFGQLTVQMRRDLATSFALGESMPDAARRLRRSVDTLGVRRSTLIARTEIQRVANSTADKLYRANQSVIKGVQWVATLDDRTCFPAGTMISTPTGPVPIERLEVGDEVIGGSGVARSVVATHRREYDGEMAHLELFARDLYATADHRVATPTGWRRLNSVEPECEVFVLEELGDLLSEGSIADPGFLDMKDGDATLGESPVPESIVLDLMPIQPVHLQGHLPVGQVEVDGQPAELVLLLVDDPTLLKPLSDDGFGSSLATESPITAERAEAPAGSFISGNDAVALTAMVASVENRRAAALLGAMLSVGATGLGIEGTAAPFTRSMLPSEAALLRTEGIAIGVRLGNGEIFLASRASLRDASASMVGAEALSTTEGTWAATETLKRGATRLAGAIQSGIRSGFTALVGAEGWGGSAVPYKAAAASTVRSLFRHTSKVATHRAGVKLYEGNETVYDIQVDRDHSFYANGVLVHNCLICAPLDGETWEVSDNSRPLPVSDTHAACRCYLSPVTRSFREMGIDADDFSPTTRAAMDGQVPATVKYRDFFSRQSETFQRRVLGERRFELFKAGEVDIDSFARNQRILSLDELPTVDA